MRKLFSVVTSLVFLANSLLYPFSFVYAQEATLIPEPTPFTSPSPTMQAGIPTPSPWTFENIELNKEYVAPQNSGVKLTFTKLPSITGSIKIEEITLTEEQIKQTGSLSDKAYDITSDMVDGTFTYNLSLPIPESSRGKDVKVKFAEELADISSAKQVNNSVSKTDTSVSVNNLDHFTIFITATVVSGGNIAATQITTGSVNPSINITLTGDTFTASGTSNLPTNWTINTGTTSLAIGTITGTNNTAMSITFTGTTTLGTISIQANAAALTTGGASNTVNVSVMDKIDQTITFGALSGKTDTDPNFSISATASSGLPVSFSSLTTSICTIVSGSTVHLVTAGTCTIRASQLGNADYNPAPNVPQSFFITDTTTPSILSYTVSQTIISPQNQDGVQDSVSIDLLFSEQVSAEVNIKGGLENLIKQVYYSAAVTDPPVLVWDGKNTAGEFVDDALYYIEVSITDPSGYKSDDISKQIRVDNTPPVITLNGTAPDVEFGGTYTDLGATANDAVSGSFAATRTGTVNTSVIGSYVITYSASDAAGNPAIPVTRTVNVVKANQTITFGAVPSKTYGDGDFSISATASSGLTVSFGSQTPSICTVSGSTVHIVTAGSCTIRGTQSGNSNYNVAPDVDRLLTIARANSQSSIICNPKTYTYTASAITPCTGQTWGLGVFMSTFTPNYSNNINVGTADVNYTFPGNVNFNGSADEEIFTITKANAVISVLGYTGVYDGNPHGATLTSALGVGSEDLTGSVNLGSLFTLVPGGTAHWTLVNANYNDQSGDATIIITQKEITVTADAKSKEKGDADPTLTYVPTPSLFGSDAFTGLLTREIGESVGTYAITQGTLSVGANYIITFVSANLTISDTIAPTLSVYTVSEPIISPNGDGTKDSSTIDIAYSEQVIADINILDDQGIKVRDLYYSSAVINPDPKIWDGKNNSNMVVNDGVYTIEIKGTNSAGHFVYDTSRTITVDNTAPVITLNGDNPQIIMIGSGYLELGATADDGSTVIIDASNFVDAVGSYIVTYNTTDNVGNVATQVTRTVNVIKANQTITWANPTDITYGTALSGTELNAVSSGDGISLYTPLAGTVLNAGNSQTLSVTFSATDNYNEATQTVQINVDPKPITVTADAKSKERGDVDPELTYTGLASLVGGDVFTGSLSRDAGEAVGAYAINQDTLSLDANYIITFVGANLTISDTTVPTLTTVSMISNNANPVYAKTGHTITLTFTGDETINTPTVTVLGQSATVSNLGGDNWKATYLTTGIETEGLVPFTIGFSDISGNSGINVTTTTDDSTVTYDATNPTTTTPSTTTPTNSTSQVWSWTAATDLNGIAGYSWRTSDGQTGTTTNTFQATSFLEGIWSFFVKAIDNAGNEGDESEGIVTVDTTVPTLTTVSMISNNANPVYAKTGHTITLTFTGDETINTPTVTILGQSATVSNLGGDNWQATYAPTGIETEGLVPFTIGFSDISGNSGINVTTTTDDSTVTYDTTNPEGNWVAPIADAVVSGIVPLNFSATDNLSGVVSVIYEYKRNDGVDTYHMTGSNWDTTALALDTYTLKVVVADKAGNFIESTRQVGVTAIVSNQSSTTPSADSAIITWTTDRPTKSRVIYDTFSHPILGSAPNYGYAWSTGTSDVYPKATSHSVTIGGLSSNTVYYYRTVSEGSPTTVSDQKEYRTLSIAGAPDPTGGAGGQVVGVSTVALSNYQYSQFDDSLISNEEVLRETTESEKTQTPEVKGTETKDWNARNIALISFGSALMILALLLLWRKNNSEI